jgi:cystathionine beta-lyase/cystathionine gamma-synthase
VSVGAIAEQPRAASVPSTLLAAAIADLRADLDELAFLCHSAQTALADAETELAATALQPRTHTLLSGQLDEARRRYRATAARLRSLGKRARSAPPTLALVSELAGEKASVADLLRSEQALLAALAAAADWQSPSFGQSGFPAAGRHEGRIRPHWNDYKRDRHLDADAYERAYLQEMVDGPLGLRALLTSCGMAAFTTVLSYLQFEGKLERPVLAGAGLYHETKLLLERALPGRVRYADERDTAGFVQAIDAVEPSAVFLDSLSNTATMAVPEMARLLERLAGTSTYLVVDNTGLSVACQPFALAAESVRLLVWESLLKYAQLGLDRANAGVIVARARDAERLDDYREHLGTNIADVAVHALPRPDRHVLERRLLRLQRNALFLAERLRERAPASIEVVYPGLPSHPCARAAAALPCRGGCLAVVFRDSDRRLRRERALVEAALAEAGRLGVPLLGGSSFGFDTSRVYLTAAQAACGNPFVRVAAGTEHRLALEPLADALAAAIAAAAR